MRKITFYILLGLLSFTVTCSIIGWIKNECRCAYSNGYVIGIGQDFCNIGFIYYPEKPDGEKFEYVGVGNEEYPEWMEGRVVTGRLGKKYWWAEKRRIK